MRRKIENEDSRPLNQTQLTLVNSSCHKGIQRKNAFLLKNGFLLEHIYTYSKFREIAVMYSYKSKTSVNEIINQFLEVVKSARHHLSII